MVVKLDKLIEIDDLRSVWPQEALDFTPWLAREENMELLSSAVGIEIAVDETESSFGDCRVDIVASESDTGRTIIIENQLEETNHDHLGKLIAYAAGKSADIIIWLVKNARDDHRAAIEWLNNNTDEKIGFFLCEIKLFKIGDSALAPKFEVIEKPNNWVKENRKAEMPNETKRRRYEYWNRFNDYAFRNETFSRHFKRRKPSFEHWMDFSIGSSACHLAIDLIQQRNELVLELYIGSDKDLYDHLYANKCSIENEAGMQFDWRPLRDKKASRILITRQVDYNDSNAWPQQFDWIMDTLIKMKQAFKKYI